MYSLFQNNGQLKRRHSNQNKTIYELMFHFRVKDIGITNASYKWWNYSLESIGHIWSKLWNWHYVLSIRPSKMYGRICSCAYTASEVSLDFAPHPVDLSFYSANDEWDLVFATSSRSRSKSRRGISFSSLTYSFKHQRRPMFQLIYTLFPVAIIAILIAMVYKLLAKSGEKICFSLTVLLAYAVYLTMISNNIPSTSVNICYLC